MKRPPRSSFPPPQHLFAVHLPRMVFWAENEDHAAEQYLNALGLTTGAMSIDAIDFRIEEVDHGI